MHQVLNKNKVSYALEAHNAASAKIVQESNFDAIWASGFTLSASLGHRDCNELSWTNLCDQFEYMTDCTSIPIIVDGDTGFGNFNNVRMLIKKLEKIKVSGVVLEDKIFPKTNSFIEKDQPLISIEEFQGKIRAAKDTQINPNFAVIARTEAFIVGKGLQAALDRAYAYEEAGADAILVHSKKSTIEEIEMFCLHWKGVLPLVIIPTTYWNTQPELYEKLGVSLVIFANHLFRSSLLAMRNTAKQIYKQKSTAILEGRISSLNEIFDLVDEQELRILESKYLPK